MGTSTLEGKLVKDTNTGDIYSIKTLDDSKEDTLLKLLDATGMIVRIIPEKILTEPRYQIMENNQDD